MKKVLTSEHNHPTLAPSSITVGIKGGDSMKHSEPSAGGAVRDSHLGGKSHSPGGRKGSTSGRTD